MNDGPSGLAPSVKKANFPTIVERLLEILLGVFPVAVGVLAEALFPNGEEPVVEVFADQEDFLRVFAQPVDRLRPVEDFGQKVLPLFALEQLVTATL